MFIRSERLFLRPCWPEDCEELFALVSDEAVISTMPAREWPASPGEAGAMISPAGPASLPQFLITLPGGSGARLIGAISLVRFEREVELFFCIAPEERGRGYAAEAVRAVLSLARALGLPRVAACCFAEDRASARLLDRAGFRPTGVTRLRPRRLHGEYSPASELAVEFAIVGAGSELAPMRAA